MQIDGWQPSKQIVGEEGAQGQAGGARRSEDNALEPIAADEKVNGIKSGVGLPQGRVALSADQFTHSNFLEKLLPGASEYHNDTNALGITTCWNSEGNCLTERCGTIFDTSVSTPAFPFRKGLYILKERENQSHAYSAVLDFDCDFVYPNAVFHALVDCLFPSTALLFSTRTLQANSSVAIISPTNLLPYMEIFCRYFKQQSLTNVSFFSSFDVNRLKRDGLNCVAGHYPMHQLNIGQQLSTWHIYKRSIDKREKTGEDLKLDMFRQLISSPLNISCDNRCTTIVLICRLQHSRIFLDGEELISALGSEFGAERIRVYYGNESLEETVHIFNSACAVVGYHGAGSMNLVFSCPGTLHLELTTYSGALIGRIMSSKDWDPWRTNEAGLTKLLRGIRWEKKYIEQHHLHVNPHQVVLDDSPDRNGDRTIKEANILLTREHIDDITARLRGVLPTSLSPLLKQLKRRKPNIQTFRIPQVKLGFGSVFDGQEYCSHLKWKPVCWGEGSCTSAWPDVLLRPNQSCPMFLEALALDQGGLGHCFMSFNSVLRLASSNHLTIRSRYGCSAHGAEASLIQNAIFGNQFWTETGSCIPVYIDVSLANLSQARSQYQATNCAQKNRSHCALFRLKDKLQPAENGIDPCGYRAAFLNHQDKLDSNDLKVASTGKVKRVFELATSSTMKIAVHMRQGDVLQGMKEGTFKRDDFMVRTIPNQFYLEMLRKIMQILQENGKTATSVTLHVEGASNATHVPNLDGTFTDFETPLGVYGASIVFGPAHPVLALADICSSQIFVGAKSGFTHLAALLCVNTLTLAPRFWHSYDYLPNTILLETKAGLFSLNVSGTELKYRQFDLDKLQSSNVLPALRHLSSLAWSQ